MSNSLQTIEKMMLILNSYDEKNQSYTLTEFSRSLEMSKSSIQRILNSLVKHKLLEKDETTKKYKLGIELYYLGELAEINSNLISAAKPLMDEARDKTGESISLNVIKDKMRKCISYSEGNHELRTLSYIGQKSPLYVGASAKLLLAFLPETKKRKFLEELDIEKKEDFIKNIEEIKNNNYVLSYEERVKGGFSLSCPIKDKNNKVIASVTISMPIVRVNEHKINEYISLMKKTAEDISFKIN